MMTDPVYIGTELKKIRGQRMYLWLVSLSYVPMMYLTFVWNHADTALFVVLAIWMFFLGKAVLVVAFSLCPRCGNYFHMKGFFPNYLLRRCLHCGLRLNADKESVKPPSAQ